MWSLVFWKDTTTSVELSNGVEHSSKGTRIRWHEDNCFYDFMKLRNQFIRSFIHNYSFAYASDDRDFLLSLNLDTNGVLHFSIRKDASTQTLPSLICDHQKGTSVISSSCKRIPENTLSHPPQLSQPSTPNKSLHQSLISPVHQSSSCPKRIVADQKRIPTKLISNETSSSACQHEDSLDNVKDRSEPSTSSGITDRHCDRNELPAFSKIPTASSQYSPSPDSSVQAHVLYSLSNESTGDDDLITLNERSSTVIPKMELDNILYKQKDDPWEMVRQLLLKIVGPNKLIKMTPFGHTCRGFNAIPTQIYTDVRSKADVEERENIIDSEMMDLASNTTNNCNQNSNVNTLSDFSVVRDALNVIYEFNN